VLIEILVVYDSEWKECHFQDYLQISGYKVTLVNINSDEDFDSLVFHKDVVIILCRDAGLYFDICREYRRYTDVPIMVISESNDEWTKIKMFQSGVDDYISEPYQEMALIARIQARCEQYRRLTSYFGCVKTDDIVIEAIYRRVYRHNQEVFLTMKEFNVLFYLAQRKSIVVTKEELYKEVWNQNVVDNYSETVTTYIMRLRQKIEDDPDNPKHIETVWGVGYRFVG
jgi:DNA-binding response OmpR family regulator